MAKVFPFKAIRPTKDKVHLVASRSIDGYNVSELKDKLSSNPFSFLHIINPDFEDGITTRPGSNTRLKKIKKKFQSFLKEKIFLKDDLPSYYIYSQIKNNNKFIGIIACTSIDDYINGVIKVHEQTITSREEKLKAYLEVCEFNAEPVLFCYPNDEKLDNLIYEVSKNEPDYDFTTSDKVNHSLWVVNDTLNVQLISKQFSTIPSIYIADGHHRSASSALLGILKRKSKKNFSGTEAFNYYLGVFFSETQLKIYDYNRIIKDLNNLTLSELLKKLKHKFDVSEVNSKVFKPVKKHQFSMYTHGKWFSLICKKSSFDANDVVGSLDAFILTELILSPIFDIHDLKIDKRIAFISGIKGAEALKKSVDDGLSQVAFGLFPVTLEHLKLIADTNNIMPPKSTWVEPKMRSGLVIYSFDEDSE